MKNRLLALALCLVMTLGLAAPSFAVQADAPGGLDGAEPDFWDILAPDAPGGLDSEETSLPASDELAQLDEPEETIPEEAPDLTQIGENAPAESCLYCGAEGAAHADYCPLYVPAESGNADEPAPAQPSPVLAADPETPAVPLETVLSQTPAQAVRTLSADQPGVLSESQRFSAFTRLNQTLFSSNDVEPAANDELVDNDGIETQKNVEYNDETGKYDVTIESYVTGQTVTTTTAAPADIVLILDRSKEMAGTGYLDAMQKAANQFINMAATTDGVRRIALVSYAGSSAEVLSGSQESTEDALVPVDDAGKAALTEIVNKIEVDSDGNAYCQYGIARAVQIFQSYSSTTPRYVILLSAGVFGDGDRSSDNTTHSAQIALHLSTVLKTAITKTPDIGWTTDAFYESGKISQSAVETNLTGNYLVDWEMGCGAEVYCVGLNMPIQKKEGKAFGNLEYSTGTVVEDENNMAGYGNTAARINEAMYRISSDRPDSSHVTRSTINKKNQWEVDAFNVSRMNPATYYQYKTLFGYSYWTDSSVTNSSNISWSGTYPDWATRNMPGGHFLTGDTQTIGDRFEEIFKNIQSSSSTASVKLDSTTVLTDVVTKYFEIPEDTNVITAKVVDAFNEREVDDQLTAQLVITPTANLDGTTSVTVTGFDYAANFVNEEERTGKKLVLTFTIQPKAGFLGGNGVPTNVLEESGVSTGDGDMIENLPDPGTQDIALAEIELTLPDKSIYLSQVPTEANLLAGAEVRIKGQEDPLPLTAEEQENDWRFDYVTLSLDLTSGGTEFTDCTGISASAMLHDKADKTQTSQTSADTAVHVFRPTVTVTANDVWADYGKEINLAEWCVSDGFTTSWAHSCGAENVPEPTGDAPEIRDLAYSFDLGSNGLYTTAEDDAVGTITGLTYAVGGETGYKDLLWEVSYPENDGHFTIHINRFDLEVTKNWTGAECYRQSAIFTLSTGTGKAMSTQFTLEPGKNSITVHGLICGKDYTLNEVSGWTWRYTPGMTGAVTPGEHAPISKEEPVIEDASVTFTNTLSNTIWFDAADSVSNIFKKEDDAQ